jgi:hypothetical protein
MLFVIAARDRVKAELQSCNGELALLKGKLSLLKRAFTVRVGRL